MPEQLECLLAHAHPAFRGGCVARLAHRCAPEADRGPHPRSERKESVVIDELLPYARTCRHVVKRLNEARLEVIADDAVGEVTEELVAVS